jgi:hypothetical protein
VNIPFGRSISVTLTNIDRPHLVIVGGGSFLSTMDLDQ